MVPVLAHRMLFSQRFLCVRHGKCLFTRNIHIHQTLKKDAAVQAIRNIGIIAHIDAGKTTTTERMLFYSGFTNYFGEVHDGDTVMDYMPQERERGITITSAAISFNWKSHKINLIDTPGHVDFTIEVERSLCVLDGAVTILDASAGVEVQTLTVWNQAERHKVPCVIYLNKMDKPAANVEACLISIEQKLRTKPLLLHIPIGTGKDFNGVVDILTQEKIQWNDSLNKKDGRSFSRQKLEPENDYELWAVATEKREELISNIADLDDILGEKFLSSGFDSLTDSDLYSALRRITISKSGSPVLCGSSYRNIAVQLLMDAIVKFLPSPNEQVRDFIRYYKKELCAHVFKIVHDKIRGPLFFLRLYTGKIENGQRLYNDNRGLYEKIGKLLIPFADNFREINSVSEGNIAVLSGLKETSTGDILLTSSSIASKIRIAAKVENDDVIAGAIHIPDPVFFCTIEPPSLGAKNRLDYALMCLQREDPSFKVKEDEEMGQTIVSGMGELHIDIIKERILTEYGIEAHLGPLQIAYRERIAKENVTTHVLDKALGGINQYCKITLSVVPNYGCGKMRNVKVVITKENELGKIRPDYLKSLNIGVLSALNHGPILGFPVIDVMVSLLWFETGKGTTAIMVGAAASQCIRTAFQDADSELLEPIMTLMVTVNKACVGRVLKDLAHRRSQILDTQLREDVMIILAYTPLSELKGYSSELRAITSGLCSFTMEFHHYEAMGPQDKANAIQNVTGFRPY